MLYILDTSAILSGIFFDGEMATSPKVIDEIKPGGHSWRLLEYMKGKGLKIMKPSEEALKKVRRAADATGDMASLSEADIEILALAYFLKGTLLTDDYAIQNVAREMGIEYRPILEEGIKEKFYWVYRCKSCGRIFEKYYEICPICGGKVGRVRK